MEIRRGIILPGMDEPIAFHAPIADADEQGNNIIHTYARRDTEEEHHVAHNEKESVLQDSIDEAKAKAETAKEQATMSNATSAEAKEQSASNAADYVALATKVSELSRDIDKLYTSPVYGLRMYMSERVMRQSLTEAAIGDTCLVAKPYYKQGLTFDASQYYGDVYVGDKTEHHDEWHNLLADANGKVISETGEYYRVIDTTYQTVADLSVTELLEHGHIKHIAVDELSNADTVSFYVYEYGAGEWENTEILANISANQVIDAHAVYDDTMAQDNVNVGNEINGLRGNLNNEALRQWVNDIADILNDLQANVAYIHDTPPYRHVCHIPLVDYNIKGDNTNSTFEFSTFDNSIFV